MIDTEGVEYLLKRFEDFGDYYMEANVFASNTTAFTRALLDYYFPAGLNPIKIRDHSVDSNFTQV